MVLLLQRIGNDIKRQKKSYILACCLALTIIVGKNYYLSTSVDVGSSLEPIQENKSNSNNNINTLDNNDDKVPFENRAPQKPVMPLPDNNWGRLAEWKQYNELEDTVLGQVDLANFSPQFDKPKAGQCTQAVPTEPVVNVQTQDMWNAGIKGKVNGLLNENTAIKSAKQNEKLKIILVPHSHSDPGWLKTFGVYQAETNTNLDLMLSFMPKNPRMSFQFSETSFFEAWWSRLSTEQREQVKKLIDNGQFDLPTGSWTMTDEANPFYHITVDNIIEGHQFLWQNLGFKVKSSWTNDPFGYGPTNAYLFRKAGVKHHVIHRVHREVKGALFTMGVVPFMWQQSFDTAGNDQMLTHVLAGSHYDIPGTCGPQSQVCCQFDFKRITNWGCGGARPVPITRENVAAKSKQIFDQWKQLAGKYRSPNMALVMLGDDFRYKDEQEWHQQHDNYVQIFDEINNNPSYNAEVKFGTITEYWREFEKRVGNDHSYPTLSGDFFPYTDTGGDYWTGYFTSRPFYKRRDRQLWSRIRAADVILGWLVSSRHMTSSAVSDQLLAELTLARRDLALFQHHDAITGTSKVHVVKDYGQRLFDSVKRADHVIGIAASGMLLPKMDLEENSTLVQPPLILNEQPTEYDKFDTKIVLDQIKDGVRYVHVYNGLAVARRDPVTLHVKVPSVLVKDMSRAAKPVPAQINPVLDQARNVAVLTDTFEVTPRLSTLSENVDELIFFPSLLPMSITKFAIQFESSQPASTSIATVSISQHEKYKLESIPSIFQAKSLSKFESVFSLRTSRMVTEHDPDTGLLQNVTADSIGRQQAEITFSNYPDATDGPYIFSPGKGAQAWDTKDTLIVLVQGSLSACAHSLMTRIMHNTCIHDLPGSQGEQVHISNVVDMKQMRTDEIVIRLKTDILNNDKSFYTDSLGFHFIKRQVVSRSIQANYYPMPAAAAVQNDQFRATMLGDHPHGCTMVTNGQLEIMLDRVSARDDRKGLGGGQDGLMQDAVPVRSQFTLLIEKRSAPQAHGVHAHYHGLVGRRALDSLLFPPLVLSAHSSESAPSEYSKQLEAAPSYMSLPSLKVGTQWTLPCDHELIALRPLSHSVNSWLMVLHRAAVDCALPTDTYCSQTHEALHVFLQGVLGRMGVSHVQESTLNGVTKIGAESSLLSMNFTMNPQDIRTFTFSIQPK